MMRVLDCPRRRIITRFAACCNVSATPRTRAAPIVDVAPALIRMHAQSAEIGDDVIAASPAPTYHQLRIRCKRLRYALEAHVGCTASPRGGWPPPSPTCRICSAVIRTPKLRSWICAGSASAAGGAPQRACQLRDRQIAAR
jgi:hypothetical protein